MMMRPFRFMASLIAALRNTPNNQRHPKRDVVPVSAPFEPRPMRRNRAKERKRRARSNLSNFGFGWPAVPRVTGGFSGNSHQRGIQRRRNERRIRLAAA